MMINRRSRGVLIAAATAAAAMAVSVTGAQAATPDWKAGHFPGCDFVSYTSSYSFWDFSKPKIVSFTPASVVRVGNGAAVSKTFAKVHAKDSCSGVANVYADGVRSGVDYFFAPPAPAAGTWWDTTATLTNNVGQSDVGKLTWPAIRVYDRWVTFTLNTALDTVSSPTGRSCASPELDCYRTAAGLSSSKVTYILRDTTLSSSKNKSSVKKGKAVTVSGTLKVADGSAYSGLDVSKVSLQRRYAGSSKWVTVGSDISDGSGHVSVSNKPSKSAYYRLVYTGKYSAPWNAPRTSSSTTKVTVH